VIEGEKNSFRRGDEGVEQLKGGLDIRGNGHVPRLKWSKKNVVVGSNATNQNSERGGWRMKPLS